MNLLDLMTVTLFIPTGLIHKNLKTLFVSKKLKKYICVFFDGVRAVAAIVYLRFHKINYLVEFSGTTFT